MHEPYKSNNISCKNILGSEYMNRLQQQDLISGYVQGV